MGFRFQKRIKILPGVTINLSKSGISTSLGPKGAKVTIGHGKIRKTVGLPGTGLSHTTVKNYPKPWAKKTNEGSDPAPEQPIEHADSTDELLKKQTQIVWMDALTKLLTIIGVVLFLAVILYLISAS